MDDLEASVLSVYSDVSPSKTDADQDSDWNALVARRTVALVDRLKLLPELFAGKSLLDLGVGTGEYAAVYAFWGANVSGVDFNPVSIARAKQFFSDRGGEVAKNLNELITSSLSEWEPTHHSYDICTSDGVLHHLSDPREGLEKMCAALKPGGLLYVSVGHPAGSLQRDLMAQMVKDRSSDLAQAVRVAEDLFPEYMERATTYGYRTAEQVVNDNFLVPQDARMPASWWIQELDAQGVDLFTSWPSLLPEIPEPVTVPPVNPLDPVALVAMDRHSTSWAWSRDESLTVLKQFVSDDETNACADGWPTELQAVLEAMRGPQDLLKRVLLASKIFGRGYCGLGDLNLVGRKRAAAQ